MGGPPHAVMGWGVISSPSPRHIPSVMGEEMVKRIFCNLSKVVCNVHLSQAKLAVMHSLSQPGKESPVMLGS